MGFMKSLRQTFFQRGKGGEAKPLQGKPQSKPDMAERLAMSMPPSHAQEGHDQCGCGGSCGCGGESEIMAAQDGTLRDGGCGCGGSCGCGGH